MAWLSAGKSFPRTESTDLVTSIQCSSSCSSSDSETSLALSRPRFPQNQQEFSWELDHTPNENVLSYSFERKGSKKKKREEDRKSKKSKSSKEAKKRRRDTISDDENRHNKKQKHQKGTSVCAMEERVSRKARYFSASNKAILTDIHLLHLRYTPSRESMHEPAFQHKGVSEFLPMSPATENWLRFLSSVSYSLPSGDVKAVVVDGATVHSEQAATSEHKLRCAQEKLSKCRQTWSETSSQMEQSLSGSSDWPLVRAWQGTLKEMLAADISYAALLQQMQQPGTKRDESLGRRGRLLRDAWDRLMRCCTIAQTHAQEALLHARADVCGDIFDLLCISEGSRDVAESLGGDADAGAWLQRGLVLVPQHCGLRDRDTLRRLRALFTSGTAASDEDVWARVHEVFADESAGDLSRRLCNLEAARSLLGDAETAEEDMLRRYLQSATHQFRRIEQLGQLASMHRAAGRVAWATALLQSLGGLCLAVLRQQGETLGAWRTLAGQWDVGEQRWGDARTPRPAPPRSPLRRLADLRAVVSREAFVAALTRRGAAAATGAGAASVKHMREKRRRTVARHSETEEASEEVAVYSRLHGYKIKVPRSALLAVESDAADAAPRYLLQGDAAPYHRILAALQGRPREELLRDELELAADDEDDEEDDDDNNDDDDDAANKVNDDEGRGTRDEAVARLLYDDWLAQLLQEPLPLALRDADADTQTDAESGCGEDEERRLLRFVWWDDLKALLFVPSQASDNARFAAQCLLRALRHLAPGGLGLHFPHALQDSWATYSAELDAALRLWATRLESVSWSGSGSGSGSQDRLWGALRGLIDAQSGMQSPLADIACGAYAYGALGDVVFVEQTSLQAHWLRDLLLYADAPNSGDTCAVRTASHTALAQAERMLREAHAALGGARLCGGGLTRALLQLQTQICALDLAAHRRSQGDAAGAAQARVQRVEAWRAAARALLESTVAGAVCAAGDLGVWAQYLAADEALSSEDAETARPALLKMADRLWSAALQFALSASPGPEVRRWWRAELSGLAAVLAMLLALQRAPQDEAARLLLLQWAAAGLLLAEHCPLDASTAARCREALALRPMNKKQPQTHVLRDAVFVASVARHVSALCGEQAPADQRDPLDGRQSVEQAVHAALWFQLLVGPVVPAHDCVAARIRAGLLWARSMHAHGDTGGIGGIGGIGGTGGIGGIGGIGGMGGRGGVGGIGGKGAMGAMCVRWLSAVRDWAAHPARATLAPSLSWFTLQMCELCGDAEDSGCLGRAQSLCALFLDREPQFRALLSAQARASLSKTQRLAALAHPCVLEHGVAPSEAVYTQHVHPQEQADWWRRDALVARLRTPSSDSFHSVDHLLEQMRRFGIPAPPT